MGKETMINNESEVKLVGPLSEKVKRLKRDLNG